MKSVLRNVLWEREFFFVMVIACVGYEERRLKARSERTAVGKASLGKRMCATGQVLRNLQRSSSPKALKVDYF